MKVCENCLREFKSQKWECLHCGFLNTMANRRYTNNPNPYGDKQHDPDYQRKQYEAELE